MNKIIQVIHKEKKTAVFPMVCADHCAQLVNMDFAKVVTDGEKLYQVLEYGYNFYKYDMALLFSDPYVEAQAMGCHIRYEPSPTLISPISNHGFDRRNEIYKAASLLKQKLDVPVFVSIKGPFSLAAFTVGIEDFLKMTLSNPKKAKNTIEQATAFQTEYIEQLTSFEVNIMIGDPLASTSVISPKVFSEFAYSPLKYLIQMIKNKGLISAVHICGDTEPIISMIDTLGADILSIEDITLKTKTLKMGGVSTETILNGDTNSIRKEIETALQEPYLILSTSCDVPAKTDPENIKTMIRLSHAISKN